jgi:hypothetical protein
LSATTIGWTGRISEGAGAGVQIVASHQSFREYMLTLAKAP